MTPQIPNPQNISERVASIEKTLSSPQFLGNEGIGNEVPFFIFAYQSNCENAVVDETRHLIARLENTGIGVLEINLYDLVVGLIQERGKWDRLLKAEKSMSKDKFKTQLQNLTDVETKLIPAIADRISTQHNLQILFLTGVGLVYPYIRTHNVLNNLQKVAKDYPTLLFFPGHYTYTEGRGQSLDLFGELNEDKYYRAFNIENYKL
jgi:hypothetical protein